MKSQGNPGFPNPKMFFLVRLFQVTLVLVVKFSEIWAYSSGPPLGTCEYMVPHHSNNKAQTGKSPYNISVYNSSYTAGQNLTVKIFGTNTFKGFILQARRTDGSLASPVGEFVEIPSGTYSYLFQF